LIIQAQCIELGQGKVVEVIPGLAAIMGEMQTPIVPEPQSTRVMGIDLKSMMIHMHAASPIALPTVTPVLAPIKRHPRKIEARLVMGINPNLPVVVGRVAPHGFARTLGPGFPMVLEQ